MPEGPEVKIMSDYLNEVLDGHVISKIDCISEPYKNKYGNLVNSFQSYLPFEFKPSFCVGKESFIMFTDRIFFSYHLGMTGFWSTTKSKHAHLQFTTSSGVLLFFHDTRRFGNIKLLDKSMLSFNEFHNGDFLNFEINLKDYAHFLNRSLKTSREVCKVLLDQRFFSGVGNYLKSEILYACEMHPHRLWSSLNYDDIYELCSKTKHMLFKSYSGGGAQLRDFKNPSFAPDLTLLIYGKTMTSDNLNVISEITNDNRRTFWCPSIQKL